MNVDTPLQDQTLSPTYHPYVFFRIDKEYLAVSAFLIKEITTLRAMHRVPYRKVPFIDGVVNVNGRLRVLISLKKLFKLPKTEEMPQAVGAPLVLIEKEEFAWTFVATEVFGVLHVTPESIQKPPVTIMKGTTRYIKGLFASEKGLVGLLDEELLFLHLRHNLET